MRFIFLLLFVPFVLNAQTLKPGLYIKTNVKFIDGSDEHLRNFVKYRFLQDGTVQVGVEPLFYSVQTTYSANDSILTIGKISYKLDYLKNDSLVIHENAFSADPENFRQYFFLNASAIPHRQQPGYNSDLKDSVYTASKWLFAQYNGTYNSFLSKLEPTDHPCYLRIIFIITKEGQLVDFTVLENKNATDDLVKKTADTFRSQLKEWIPAQINNKNVNVSIEMSIQFNYQNYNGTPKASVVARFISH